MEELRSAMEQHLNQMADIIQKLSSEFRSGMDPAYDNFMGFFHAIDWKVSSISLFLLCYIQKKNINFFRSNLIDSRFFCKLI